MISIKIVDCGTWFLRSVAFLLIAGCGGLAKTPDWRIDSVERWVTNDGLQNVESVFFDATHDILYATNGQDYKPGSDGFISKISISGKMLTHHWVDSLSRPTGMAMLGSVLFVADVNALVSIDARTGMVIERYDAPTNGAGLNDVTIDEEGAVYVSASSIHGVYKLEAGQLVLWAQDEEQLAWANGLEWAGDQLLVAGMHLSRIERKTKEIIPIETSPKVKDFEGIVSVPSGGYFVTTVENSALYYLDRKGSITKLREGDDYFGDLSFDAPRMKLYIPRGNHQQNEYFISVVHLEGKPQ